MEEAFCCSMKSYSKLQTCPLVILYSIPADSIRGPPYNSIGAMGSVDRVITLGGVGGVVGNRRPGSYIIIVGVLKKLCESNLSKRSKRNHFPIVISSKCPGFMSSSYTVLRYVTHWNIARVVRPCKRVSQQNDSTAVFSSLFCQLAANKRYFYTEANAKHFPGSIQVMNSEAWRKAYSLWGFTVYPIRLNMLNFLNTLL